MSSDGGNNSDEPVLLSADRSFHPSGRPIQVEWRVSVTTPGTSTLAAAQAADGYKDILALIAAANAAGPGM